MPEAATPSFRRHEKVVAATDLPGIPAGTRGVVMYLAGFTWPRVRVRFDNGVERGSLDSRHLMSVEAWEAQEAEAARELRRAEQQRIAAELRAKVVANPSGSH